MIEGNVKTKPQVILRELLFAENDSIQFKNLNRNLSESKLNIINTGLFYSVVFNLKNWEGKNIDLYITVEEKWYTYPIPTIDIFDRNFNYGMLNTIMIGNDYNMESDFFSKIFAEGMKILG